LRVGILQAHEDAERAADAARAVGLTPVLLPQLRFVPDDAPLSLARYDLTLITSPRALAALQRLARPAASYGRALAVHPRTAALVRQAGLALDEQHQARRGDELLDGVPPAPPALDLLIPRGNLTTDALAARARARGHRVDDPVLYRTEAVDYTEAEVATLLADPPEALLFTSPSTFAHFEARFGRDVVASATRAAIGPTTARALERAGVPAHVVTPEPDVEALIAALSRHLRGDPHG
jgi:uroporphyrinogen-III synthase